MTDLQQKSLNIIKADPAKNLLIIQLEGFLPDSETEDAAGRVAQSMEQLKPGFTVINDIAKVKPASQKGAEHIKSAQAAAIAHKVGKIIRVVDNPITKMQFKRKSSEAGYNENIEVHEVASIEEALNMV